jgi:hypothetical protein
MPFYTLFVVGPNARVGLLYERVGRGLKADVGLLYEHVGRGLRLASPRPVPF